MQQKHKPQLDCGVDGINIIFSSIYETEQDVYHFVRNECNKKIEYATLKKIKVTNEQVEYSLYVNLPKLLRMNNIKPFVYAETGITACHINWWWKNRNR